jgi:polyferredoxin
MRRAFQCFLILIVLYAVFTGGDVEKYCPAGGMSSLAGQIVNGTMSCQMSAINIFMFFSVVGSVLICGRLFCSFLCPLGTVSEALSVAGKKAGLALNIGGIPDKLLRVIKYILLYWVLKETFNTSELFCKTFDPYFALASGFKHEVVPWAAAITLVTLVGGAIVGKLFWCKYVCFFGAMQNLFSTVFGVLAGLIYAGSVYFVGGPADFPAFFGIICAVGYFSEITVAQKWLPLIKVSRNPDTCTSCGLCDRACPYGIKVSSVEKVTHPDCYLCGDCVRKCPVNNTLTYKPFGADWLAPLLTVLLIVVGMAGAGYLGNDSAFATVRFVPDGLVVDGKTVALYEKAGVTNISCYGSSMSFIQRLQDKKGSNLAMNWKSGILGAETYASTKTFKVYYDPRLTNEAGIDSMIFRSGKLGIHGVCAIDNLKVPTISIWKAGIWELLDNWSIATLQKKLKLSPHIFAFETHFGEPVVADIYYDGKSITKDEIRALVENPDPVRFSEKKVVTFNFKVNGAGDSASNIPAGDFKKLFFPYVKQDVDKELIEATLDGGSDTGSVNVSEYFEIPLLGLDDPFIAWSMPQIAGHLKALDGVLQIRTGLNEQYQSVLKIWAIDGTVTGEALEKSLSESQLRYSKRGESQVVLNPFKVTGAVKVIDSVRYNQKEK